MMTKDYKNFSKVADLAVERAKLKNVESPKFWETETINQYREKKMAYTLFKTSLCVKNSVREKNVERSTSETMLMDEIKRKKVQKMKRSVGITCVLNVY